MIKWGGKENIIILKCIVPGSGQIDMRGLAREKDDDDYTSGATPSTPYTMKDLAEGGSSGGSGLSFEETNTNSSSYPNTGTPHAMNEWYSYDHDAEGGGGETP